MLDEVMEDVARRGDICTSLKLKHRWEEAVELQQKLVTLCAAS